MQVERKGTGDTIKLRLALSQKSSDELRGILIKRDPGNPRRYSWDAKTRNAALVVLRVRREHGVVQAPAAATKPRRMTKAAIQSILSEIDALNTQVGDLVERIREGGHPDALAIAEGLDEECVSLASARDVADGLWTKER